MPSYTITPVNRTSGTVLAKGFGPVPSGEEWSVAVRVCALGTTDGVADLVLRLTNGTNAGYRHKGFEVILGSGSYDLETNLTIPAGYELWDRSGAGDVQFSYSGTKRSTA